MPSPSPGNGPIYSARSSATSAASPTFGEVTLIRRSFGSRTNAPYASGFRTVARTSIMPTAIGGSPTNKWPKPSPSPNTITNSSPPKAVTAFRKEANSSPKLYGGFGGSEKIRATTFPISLNLIHKKTSSQQSLIPYNAPAKNRNVFTYLITINVPNSWLGKKTLSTLISGFSRPKTEQNLRTTLRGYFEQEEIPKQRSQWRCPDGSERIQHGIFQMPLLPKPY